MKILLLLPTLLLPALINARTVRRRSRERGLVSIGDPVVDKYRQAGQQEQQFLDLETSLFWERLLMYDSFSTSVGMTAPTYPPVTTKDGAVVRFLYLSPSDRQVRSEYVDAIGMAAHDVQRFFADELGDGQSFALTDPVVEVVESANDAEFFGVDLWTRSIDATGARPFDPDEIFIIYVDAQKACGSPGIGGTSCIAVLAENDLLGLTGQFVPPDCSGAIDTGPVTRWIGGLGHVLGHALYLPHPPGCDEFQSTCDVNTLMWLGFRTYPSTYLREDEKAILREGGYMTPFP